MQRSRTGVRMSNRVVSVSLSGRHNFSKAPVSSIVLVKGLGVEGDAHFGTTVQHRSRVRADPTQPNLRQVHVVHSELFEELVDQGFTLQAGDLGENITTRGLDLLRLPQGTLLRIGTHAVVEVTGLRNPCLQIDRFRKGLLKAVLPRDAQGQVERKTGIMGVVLTGGEVKPGDGIEVVVPAEPHSPLKPV